MAKKTVVRQVVYFGEEEWVDRVIEKSFPLGKQVFHFGSEDESYIEIRQLEPLTGMEGFVKQSGKQES